jgi:serine/threonine-protein kinase
MANQHDRTPPSAEVSLIDIELDQQASARCDSVTQDAAFVAGRTETDISARDSVASTDHPRDGTENHRLAIGQRLSGRYRIERVLGEGGMGVVYLAIDEQIPGEIFAIKVLKETLSPEVLELLREEVRKTRKLSHPNIVDVHSVNIDGTRLYLLMEYLEGKPLNALLDEDFGQGMPLSRAMPIIEDACAALSYAHKHNVIHRDLKPANIFVTTSGRTKLLDFGIAQVSRGPLMQKRYGPLALTPAYASCEMLVGEEADRRDDIHSLGCLIYEMLCAERPFGRLNALEAREQGIRVPPLGVLSRRQNKTLAQALAFDRQGRTAAVEQLLAGLVNDKFARGREQAVLGAALIATLAALGLTFFVLDKIWISKRSVVVQTAPSDTLPVAATPKSIAVLPLLDLSAGHEQQYFADGLTTALIDRLTQFPGLSVTGQTSSFAVKDSKEDAPTLGRRLHVEYLLEGTVRGSAAQLHVSTRLLRAADGFELWSEVFDRSGSEILKLEDDIVRAVGADLHGSLIEIPAPAVPSTRSLEAYRLLLQADHVWRQRAATDDERALIDAALQYAAELACVRKAERDAVEKLNLLQLTSFYRIKTGDNTQPLVAAR